MNKLTVLLAITVAMLSCNPADNLGEKVAIKKSEVYFKEGATKKEAKALGDYLLESEWFDEESTKSAQLTKSEEEYVVRLVVDEEKLEDNQQALTTIWLMQLAISQNVFDDGPTRIVLTDKKLKDLENYPIDPIAQYKVDDDTYILYNNEAFKKSDVKKLVAAFEQEGFFAYKAEKTILLNKTEQGNMIRMVVDKDNVAKNVEAFMPVYQKLLYAIQENAFGGKKTSLYLTSKADYEDFKKIPKASKEEIEQMVTEFTRQMNPASEQDTYSEADTMTSESPSYKY